ncbi:MAG: hypothetical protein IJJ20_06660 [Thermoguttaceae bacterium]|nr:hypothetical protein [Thermoguttaceae bacterium]
MRIKDNSLNDREKLRSEMPNLTEKLANKTLEQLERDGIFVFPEIIDDADDLAGDQMILQERNNSYWTGNVMGFLGCGEERLVIGSRFGGEDENDFFFLYMLNRIMDFPSIVDLETDADRDQRMFRLFLFLFPCYLRKAMRKGLFKKYICRRYNDENVLGTIDIDRHIELNTPFIGNIAYSQREFSYDNHLMELVRHTIEYIRKKPYGTRLLAQAKEEVEQIVSATPTYELYDRKKIIAVNKKNPVRHAYYHEYRSLQRLCILILQHEKHRIGSGSRQIFGVLFDGAWLWEEYINSLITHWFHHPMNRSEQSAQWLFSGSNGKAGLIYPDFISRDVETRIVADAKYKPVDNISGKDYLQVLAYMFRFDAKTGYYLYPEPNESNKDLVLQLNKGTTFERDVRPRDDVRVIKHGLKIPVHAKTYKDFVDEITQNEQDFTEIFSNGCQSQLSTASV